MAEQGFQIRALDFNAHAFHHEVLELLKGHFGSSRKHVSWVPSNRCHCVLMKFHSSQKVGLLAPECSVTLPTEILPESEKQ